MRKDKRLPMSSLMLGRAHLSEIIITAIFIGFGIGLTSSSITLFENFNAWVGVCVGLLICIIPLIFISIRTIGRRKENYIINGFFILSENENMIKSIERYKFAKSLNDYLISAFSENKALEHIWYSEALKLQDEFKTPEPRSIQIIREAIEYFLLDTLFSHLINYFKYPAEHKKNISILERDKIPTVLLKNRFLELFSRPMNDREHFIGVEETISEDQEPYVLEVDGAVFRKFLLVLPYKSIVERVDNNEIIIKTKRFSLNMKVIFDGTNTLLPEGYMEHFEGIKGFEDYVSNVVYDVRIEVSINFKFHSVFSPSGWDDYNWIDSFLDTLDKYVSKERYFDSINWNTAYTIIKCLNKKSSIKKKSDCSVKTT